MLLGLASEPSTRPGEDPRRPLTERQPTPVVGASRQREELRCLRRDSDDRQAHDGNHQAREDVLLSWRPLFALAGGADRTNIVASTWISRLPHACVAGATSRG